MNTLAPALLALIGAPLFVALVGLALLYLLQAGIDPGAVVIEFYRLAETPTLTAVPLFCLAGFVLAESGAPNRLVRLSQALLGRLPGGFAVMALVIAALFTAFTGASGMTIVALGGLVYPALRQHGHDDRFALGLVTTAGGLGLLLPPSLPLIVYGVVAGVPVDDLFLAGLVPGGLILVALGAYSVWQGRRLPQPTPSARPALGAAVRDCVGELLLPVVVLGGLLGGFIAVSETAALAILYVLLVEVGLRREVPLRRLPAIVRDCMVLVGGVLIILAAALAWTNCLVDAEVPQRLLHWVSRQVHSRLAFLLLLNVFLLGVGCLLDMFSALIIVVPLVLPLAQAYGVHPVHLGMVLLTNLEIGYSTPPVGMNLFVASLRFGRPLLDVCRASLPFQLLLLLVLVLVTYVPALSLLLLHR